MIRFLRGFGVVLLFSIFGVCSFFLGFVVLPLLQIFMKFEKTEESASHNDSENSIKNDFILIFLLNSGLSKLI